MPHQYYLLPPSEHYSFICDNYRMKVFCSQVINCKPKDLFPWIADSDKAMLWQKGVKESKILEEKKEKVGTTFTERMEENGNSLTMSGEITGYVKDKMMSFHLTSKIHEVDAEYSITTEKGGLTIEVASNIKWKFPMNLITLFIGKKIKHRILDQTQAELAELKRLCEANIKTDATKK